MCALGQKDVLVGRSHECDFPPFVKRLPACTKPTIDVNAASGRIDEQVRSHLSNGLSLFEVDMDLIQRLTPDIIIAQSHCDVCAVSQKEIEKKLGQNGPLKIISLQQNELSDLWKAIEEISEALGVAPEGKKRINLSRQKMDTIAQKTAALGSKPRIAMIEWIDPLMASGNWIPELVERAGGTNLFGKKGELSRVIGYEELVKSAPDIILFLPCGFNIERTRDELEPFSSKPGWFDLKPVQLNQVFLADGNHFFNRPGPRLVDSLEILAEVIHPDEFDFGHKNSGWQYWGFNRF